MASRIHRVLGLSVLSLCTAVSWAAWAQDTHGPRREATMGAAPPSETPRTKTDVVKEKGGKVKVFEFSGLDISGRLKSPQLLYFLNRLRAEFDRPKLPHRSFLPEIKRSTRGKTF